MFTSQLFCACEYGVSFDLVALFVLMAEFDQDKAQYYKKTHKITT